MRVAWMKHDDLRGDNLLSRLFSYAPRTGREPIEDYCTEALAWCLRASSELRGRFLHLTGISDLVEHKGVTQVATQVCFRSDDCENEKEPKSSGRFDLVIASRPAAPFAVVFEVKVRATLGSDQLKRYRRELNGGELFADVPKASRFLASLTNSPVRNALADACVQWHQVESLLRETIKAGADKEAVLELLKQFAEFLGDHGMKSIEVRKMTAEKLDERIYGAIASEQLREFLKAVRKRDTRLEEVFANAVSYDESPLGRWIGIYNRSSSPYLYFGVQLTGENGNTDYSCVVEAESRASIKTLQKKAKLRCEPREAEANGMRKFTLRQAIIPEFDGMGEKMATWFMEAIAEAQALSKLQ